MLTTRNASLERFIVGKGLGGRVLRGGSWTDNRSNCRAAYRNNDPPENRNRNNGLRLVLPFSSRESWMALC